MKIKWIKKMMVPVLAMLFVYYSQNLTQNDEPVNTVTSINNLPAPVFSEISLDTHHIVYGQHLSDYLVRTVAEVNPEISWIHSVFEALSSRQDRLSPLVSSLLSPEAEIISYEIENGDVTLNLNREFLDYTMCTERQLLSSLVWSLTEHEDISRVFFKIEGERVNNLNTALYVGSGLTRSMGINVEMETVSMNNQNILLYFLTGDTVYDYLIPVTRVVDAAYDPFIYVISALTAGARGERYISVFSHTARLLEAPLLTDNIMTLNFDSGLFFDTRQTKVSAAAMKQLIMSLTEFEEVESVSVLIDGSSRIFDNQSRPIAVPASRSFIDPFTSAH